MGFWWWVVFFASWGALGPGEIRSGLEDASVEGAECRRLIRGRGGGNFRAGPIKGSGFRFRAWGGSLGPLQALNR